MYRDTIHSVNHLTDEQAGKLFKHVLAYVNDEDPQTEDKVILLAFEPIKQYLKRDLRKYEDRLTKPQARELIRELAYWMLYRADNDRGASTDANAPTSVTVNWQYTPGVAMSPPAAAGDTFDQNCGGGRPTCAMRCGRRAARGPAGICPTPFAGLVSGRRQSACSTGGNTSNWRAAAA